MCPALKTFAAGQLSKSLAAEETESRRFVSQNILRKFSESLLALLTVFAFKIIIPQHMTESRKRISSTSFTTGPAFMIRAVIPNWPDSEVADIVEALYSRILELQIIYQKTGVITRLLLLQTQRKS
jgi:hypothetical protein